jgi:hypothetical protein
VHIGVQKKNKEQKKYGRQITRANHPADTPKQYWKISLYYASLFIVGRIYVFNRRSALNDRSAVPLVTGIVNMIHKMVSIEGYSTGFTAQSECGSKFCLTKS